MRRSIAVLAALAAVPVLAAPAAADSIVFRCGDQICRAAPDGTLRTSLTANGGHSWLSASRDGSRLAVSRLNAAYVLDGAGHVVSGPLPRGGAALVAQIAPDGSQVATLELLGELTPAPVTSPPGSPPTLGFHPYLFLAAPDGSGRDVVARDVIDTAWLGGRLLRTAGSTQPPYPRALCLLAGNADFTCERDIARDPVNDLSAPALSPDGRLLAVVRSPAEQNAGTGPIVLYDTATGGVVRVLTSNAADALPSFSPDGSRVVFSRGQEIFVTAVTGAPGSERRVMTDGVQPIWVSGGDACRARASAKPKLTRKTVSVKACAPSAGRLTVTLLRRGKQVAQRTVTTQLGGTVAVTFKRPAGQDPLRVTVRFQRS